ncbi:type I DNA topoisomerase [Treponema endosymbiont of Eucomonympha sp.]|uniref:type I DNA topoisomerase n=1 Tax=Treponema endosymbiont of Eucomonympha sp. TaxID=1580831 RepID=UPI000A49E0E2|nr:type I DNA topoisomerase [Treponema endosymbiont of Eucomonympha sp.]
MTGTKAAAAQSAAKKAQPAIKAVRKPKPAKGAKTPVRKNTLVIVESPAKAKTIEKYLGKGYTVKASMGHVIDLPKSRMAVDIDHGFEPEYITVKGRAKILQELRQDAKKSDAVLLASDNDREGEAIAWHLRNSIAEKTAAPIQRIVFNEITPGAIAEAVKHPADIDEAKVNAQKARRVLDRLVGYNLSPLLWKKVKNGLSAGRVQSVALRLICEREDEAERFIPEEYWTLEAGFVKGRAKFAAQLAQYRGEKPELKDEQSAQAIIADITGAACVVSDVKTTEKSLKPKPPFTTSTLQQAAANRLGFVSRKTMVLAQQLYEGISVGHERVGLITYMRTDSVRISAVALAEVREWIQGAYPAELPPQANEYAVGAKAQDAHEGIRPTYVKYTPDSMKGYLDRDQFRLYSIIWERFVSSQMTNALSRTTSADIAAGEAVFRASATTLAEKGFCRALKVLAAKEGTGGSLPALAVGETLEPGTFRPEQHFTQGPARYTDASIVKLLEEKGIGRPSTYAPIISVLLTRYYVTRSNKQLVPTALGRIINGILVESFSDVVNENFTAEIEQKLDGVEEQAEDWVKLVGEVFFPFREQVERVMATQESVKGTFDENTGETCEKCGRPMLKKLGRYGFFLSCSGFPECRNAKSLPLAKCPKCGKGDIISRRTARGRGREFYGCTNYPECDFLTHSKPLNAACPQCGWFMVEKHDKKNGSYKACINPDCTYLHSADEEPAPELTGTGEP